MLVCDNEEYYPQDVTPEDQALIVRAVNAHAALVAALRDIQLRTANNPGAPFVHSMNITGAVNEISTKALELAGV